MKPNILFLVIDSCRADKCYGNNKTSKTPNIDTLIKNGIYFSQDIATVDGTDPSLGCIFTGKYPFKSGIDFFRNHSKATEYFDILKESGYILYGTVPDTHIFQTLTSKFEDKDIFQAIPACLLHQGVGKLIIDRLESKRMREPWIYYIHLMDLHPTAGAFVIPDEFDNEKYGNTRYERALSATDVWIGKILKNINLDKTLVVVTADHGDYIPVAAYSLDDIGIIGKVMRKGKQLVPSLEPAGLKLYILLRKQVRAFRKRKLKRVLTSDEFRTLETRRGWHLYDELIHVPLIFAGWNIISPSLITQQVRHIDVFPTITELIGLADKNDVDGRSLVPLIQGKQVDELPSYIENHSKDPKKMGNVIGIRTSKYKYYRSRNNPKKNVVLFDLQNDPSEKINIAMNRPNIVEKMEKMLTEVREDTLPENEIEEMSAEEKRKAMKVLREMGYDE